MVNQACGSFRVKINLSNKLLLAKGSGGEGWCVIVFRNWVNDPDPAVCKLSLQKIASMAPVINEVCMCM